MLKFLLKTSVASLLLGGVANGVTVGFGSGTLTFQVLDIDGAGGATDGTINTTTEAEAIMGAAPIGTTGLVAAGGQTYNITSNVGTTHGALDINGDTARDYNVNEFNPQGFGAGTQDYLIRMTGGIFIPQGTYTVRMQGDDGGRVIIGGVEFTNAAATGKQTPGIVGVGVGNQIRFEDPTGDSNTWGEFTVGAGGVTTTIDAMFWERTGGDYWELALGSGVQTVWNTTNFPNVLASGSNGVEFHFEAYDPIPEPSGVALLALGSLVVLRRRK